LYKAFAKIVCGRWYGSMCPASSSKMIVDMRKLARPPKKFSPIVPKPASTGPTNGRVARPLVAHQKATQVARSQAAEQVGTLNDRPSPLKKSPEQCNATQVAIVLATAGICRKLFPAVSAPIAVFMSREQLNAREQRFIKLSNGSTRLKLL